MIFVYESQSDSDGKVSQHKMTKCYITESDIVPVEAAHDELHDLVDPCL